MISDIKPFIKWAGGKSMLLNEIESNFPIDFEKFDTYIEPFVGGGAVLFNIIKKYPNIKKIYINDINERLMNCYHIIKTEPKSLINELNNIQNKYLPLNLEERKNIYNELRTLFNRGYISNVKSAALFIFLNKTCFNGLYRENKNGDFNVPHGKYVNPCICDERTIYADSEALQNVEILTGDFYGTIKFASNKSIYYLDPPYKPINGKAAFNGYDKIKFDDNEQIRLKNFCNAITKSGSKFILSSSDLKNTDASNNFFDELYKSYHISRVFAKRSINSNGKKRGKIKELIISSS